MKITTFIYCLIDPRTNEVRYVGKSNNPKSRYSRHLSNSLNIKTHCYCWIKSLLDLKLKPILNILEEVPIEIWGEREDYWISQFKNLTNLLDGGKFCPMLNEKIIEKMKETKRKNPQNFSEETRKKLSVCRKEEWLSEVRKGGWKHTEEFKEKRKSLLKEIWNNRTKEEVKVIVEKISKSKIKKIIQLDLNKIQIKVWDSIKEAELFYCGKNKGHMKRQIDKNKPWKGFYWEYALKDEASDPIVVNEILN